MIEHRAMKTLSGDERSWLKARHHIAFSKGSDGLLHKWGALLAWNDDEISPGTGFPPHSHADTEIITYVREGAITHEDSLGHRGRTVAGDIQVMSAGAGIRHSEYNLEPSVTRIFQIWIAPERRGGAPSWGTKSFPRLDRSGRLIVLASGFPEDTEVLPLRARARVLGGTLRRGEQWEYAISNERLGYLVPTRGAVEVNGVRIDARDGATIKDTSRVALRALEESEVVLVDVLP
jgi:quercetin 2,3-dioxygenase